MAGRERPDELASGASWPQHYIEADGRACLLAEGPPVPLFELLAQIGGEFAGWLPEPCALLVVQGSSVQLDRWGPEVEGEGAQARHYRRAWLTLASPRQAARQISVRYRPLVASWGVGPMVALRRKLCELLDEDLLDVAGRQSPGPREDMPAELPAGRLRDAFWLFCALEREAQRASPDAGRLIDIAAQLSALAHHNRMGLLTGERKRAEADGWRGPFSAVLEEEWIKDPGRHWSDYARLVGERLFDLGVQISDDSDKVEREVRRLLALKISRSGS